MGECPESYTIERVNNDGNYEPSNTKWIPKIEQANNRAPNRIFTVRGIRGTVKQLCRHFDKPYSRTMFRIHRGVDIETALFLPFQSGRRLAPKEPTAQT